MRLSDTKQVDLTMKLSKIFIKMMADAQQKAKNEGVDDAMSLVSEQHFAKLVFEADLMKSNKGYFLLGMLAQKMHDAGPKILVETNRIFNKKNVG